MARYKVYKVYAKMLDKGDRYTPDQISDIESIYTLDYNFALKESERMRKKWGTFNFDGKPKKRNDFKGVEVKSDIPIWWIPTHDWILDRTLKMGDEIETSDGIYRVDPIQPYIDKGFIVNKFKWYEWSDKGEKAIEELGKKENVSISLNRDRTHKVAQYKLDNLRKILLKEEPIDDYVKKGLLRKREYEDIYEWTNKAKEELHNKKYIKVELIYPFTYMIETHNLNEYGWKTELLKTEPIDDYIKNGYINKVYALEWNDEIKDKVELEKTVLMFNPEHPSSIVQKGYILKCIKPKYSKGTFSI